MTQVHPIEHLRYVARSHGADPVEVAFGAAEALAGVTSDPPALLVSARRLVEHHPSNAQLWTICAHAVTSIDPRGDITSAVAEMSHDDTAGHLVGALADIDSITTVGWSGHLLDALVRSGAVHALVVDSLGDGQDMLRVLSRRDVSCELVAPEGSGTAAASSDVVVLPVFAVGDDASLAPGGALALASTAYCAGRPVWAVAAAGVRLSQPMFEVMSRISLDRPDPWAAGVDVLPHGLVTRVFSPRGGDGDGSELRGLPVPPNAPELTRSLLP